MPKIIDNLQETILREARSMLLTDGGRALTIRNVASRCHVAVGTVYNYFRSKDEMMACVMLEDWQRTLGGMRACVAEAGDVLTGLQCVYDAMAAFEGLYREAWRNYAANNDAVSNIAKRHGLLIGQLTEVVEPLLVRYHAKWDDYLPTFLAETLLSAAGRGEGSYRQVLPILTRLVSTSSQHT